MRQIELRQDIIQNCASFLELQLSDEREDVDYNHIKIKDLLAFLCKLATQSHLIGQKESVIRQTYHLYHLVREYFDSEHNVQIESVGEARYALRCGRLVDSKIIRRWLSESDWILPREYNSLSRGYPQFRETLHGKKIDDLEKVRENLRREYKR